MTYRDWLPNLIGQLSVDDQDELFNLLDTGALTPEQGVMWARVRWARRLGKYDYDGPQGWRKQDPRRETPAIPEKETPGCSPTT